MKKFALAALLAAAPLCAQNPNPQPTYAQTLSIRKPSTWLRFNGSSATTFTDAIAGNNFTTTATANAGFTTPTAAFPTQVAVLNGDVVPVGALQSVTVQFHVAPTAGQAITIIITTATGLGHFTTADSFSVTVAATTSPQTFHVGTDFSARNIPANAHMGYWVSSGQVVGCNNSTAPAGNYVYFLNSSTVPAGSNTYTISTNNQNSLSATVLSNGTVTPLQAGFDFNQKNNFSAAFSHSAWAASPNTTLDDFDWFTPHSIYVHVDQITVNRQGGATIVLASKGDYVNGNGWELDLESDAADGFPLSYRVCYREAGLAPPVAIGQSVCSGTGVNMVADGVGYDITFSDAGTGWINDDALYVNGVFGGGGAAAPVFFSQFNIGFGGVTVTIVGSGTGYPASTPINISGNGCQYSGNMNSSGGVPTGITTIRDSGCTGAPTTCALAASSGSGASVSCALQLATLKSPSPLLVGGTSGISTDSSQSAVNIDEVAVFSSALANASAVNFAYQTNWFQQIVGAPPATPPLVIFEDDALNDPDNQYALAAAIGADLKGYVRLVGVIVDDSGGSCPTLWRQMLDQAGLNQIPVATTRTFAAGGTGCFAPTNTNIYNASTPTASSAFLNSTTLYRTLLVKYSTKALQIYTAGDWSGLAALMRSGADGISSLTGIQLFNQNGTNGGAVYLQAVTYCTPSSPPTPTPCSASLTGTAPIFTDLGFILANNGTVPVYWIQGTPAATGDGLTTSRTSKDPMFLFATAAGLRNAWDTLAFLSTFTNQFVDGVTVTFSGGTGYATWTAISQTGGGTGCPARLGWMHSTGGVPDLITFQGGIDSNTPVAAVYVGIGQSCTSLPTLSLVAPTGTGVALTPHLNIVCGTLSVATVGSVQTLSQTSSTCSSHIFLNMSNTTGSNESPWFRWLSNAYMDPPPVGQPRLPR